MISPEPFPKRLTLELTNSCNLNCSMCPSQFNTDFRGGFMKPELFYKVVNEASTHLPCTLVPFFRGESTLHPNLVEFISYAYQKGLGPIQLATNGLLVDTSLTIKLLDTGLDFISFSLDTNSDQEYATLRQGGELSIVKNNVLNFIEYRNNGKHNTEIQVSATRTQINTRNIDDFISFWKPKADRVRIYQEHSADGKTGSLPSEVLPQISKRQPCLKPFADIVVYFNGQVAACNHDWFRKESLGNLWESTIEEVWHSPSYLQLRNQHLSPITIVDNTCIYCDHWKMYYTKEKILGELYKKEQEGVTHG